MPKGRVPERRQGAAPPRPPAHRGGRGHAGYLGGPARRSIDVLNEALATEIVCVLRYKRHYFMATGIHANAVAAEFLEHANEEQGHADRIAERITQLGGEPELQPGRARHAQPLRVRRGQTRSST